MNIYEFIVCAATLLNSVLIIYNISGKPVKFFKKKREEELLKEKEERGKEKSSEVNVDIDVEIHHMTKK